MKKLLSIASALVLSLSIMAGCSSPASSGATSTPPTSASTSAPTVSTPAIAPVVDPVDMRILSMAGPTAMGLVSMMDGVDGKTITDNNYTFTIATDIGEIGPKLVKGEIDIATVPANMASVLYNSTEGGVQVLGINTLGVLYLVENGDSITSIDDLNGKTIFASGKGATPEYVLNYILENNDIDATIEWKSEHAEALAAVASTENAIAMLPQPFATTAQMKNENIRVAIDLTTEWDALQKDSENPSALITGVVIARTDYVSENPVAVAAFLDHYETSVDFVNANVPAAAELVGKYNIVPANVAEKAIPACNITLIQGDEMDTKLSGYLSVLMEQNPKAVGGSLPTEDFYYNR